LAVVIGYHCNVPATGRENLFDGQAADSARSWP
jgi:hypothetical protein